MVQVGVGKPHLEGMLWLDVASGRVIPRLVASQPTCPLFFMFCVWPLPLALSLGSKLASCLLNIAWNVAQPGFRTTLLVGSLGRPGLSRSACLGLRQPAQPWDPVSEESPVVRPEGGWEQVRVTGDEAGKAGRVIDQSLENHAKESILFFEEGEEMHQVVDWTLGQI